MILKRLILVLLAVFLVMGCVGAVSAEEISSVTISVTAPTSGDQPSCDVTSITPGTSGSVSWSPADATFAPGKNYQATVMVSTALGNNFTEDITATINTFSATVIRNSNISLTVTYEFGATEMSSISTVNLVLPSPVTGETPETASSGTTGVGTPSVSWSPHNSPFNSNITYTATILVTASVGYQFDSATSATVNGQPATSVTLTSPSSLSVTYRFPETTPIEIPSVALTLTQPVTGNSPTSPSSSTTGVGTPTVVWTPTGTFVEGQVYYANITIPVTSTNYEFASSPTVTLNGVDVSSEIVGRTDTQIILNHSFEATTLKTRINSVIITGVTAPVYGATPVTSAESSTTGISSVSVSWTPTASSTFAADTTYKATIVAQITDSRYAFNTSTPSVSLNGATTSTTNVTRNSDTQITITYTFPKTESQILPTITLSANVTSGTLPLSVKFTYTVANATSKSWTYGDSSTATLSSSGTLNHTYTTAGTYTANLTATNANGTVYKTVVITVKKVGLVAGFQVSALSGTAPLTVRFTDTSVGTITSRIWNFGDGTSDNVANPTHTFTSPGSYKVILTISDGAESDSTYRTIIVKAPVSATPTMAANLTSLGTTSGEAGNLSIIPHPFDIIKEFMHLFYSIFDPVNYVMTVNES